MAGKSVGRKSLLSLSLSGRLLESGEANPANEAALFVPVKIDNRRRLTTVGWMKLKSGCRLLKNLSLFHPGI